MFVNDRLMFTSQMLFTRKQEHTAVVVALDVCQTTPKLESDAKGSPVRLADVKKSAKQSSWEKAAF